MKQIQTDAIRKIKESKCKFGDRYKEQLAPFIQNALTSFIEQSEGFAEAVMEKEKTLQGCVDSFKTTQMMSDHEVYEKCATYFFPEAKIDLVPKIIMPQEKKKAATVLNLNFADLLGGAK